jgi:hypothetical protein
MAKKKYHGDKMSKGFANMPREVVMKEYPKAEYGGPEKYNDSREGIDMLAKDNHRQMMKKPGGRH